MLKVTLVENSELQIKYSIISVTLFMSEQAFLSLNAENARAYSLAFLP